MTPTPEQQYVIAAALEGKDLCIQARAGCGKTSTLVLTANSLVKPSLYLAYNKAMAEEAKEKFPSHVEVRTTHSLAYAYVGNQYRHKLERPRGKYINIAATGGEVGKFFKIKPITLSKDKELSVAAIGLAIKSTVDSFEYSADTEIKDKHIPNWLIKDFKKRKGFAEAPFRKLVLKYAKMLWEERIDLSSIVKINHDTYMKLFQLSKPKLEGFEVIYGDEFQDVNACFLSIFCNQDAQLIAVGDSYQSIYQWRGSVDALEQLEFEELQLTKSFRFGQAIADVATKVLRDKHTGECVAQLTGMETIESTATLDDLSSEYPYTMLFRTNATLLAQAVTFIKDGVKLNIETDMSDFVKLLNSALALYTGDIKSVKHEDIIPFNTWEEMTTEAASNPELSRVAKIIKDGDALDYIRTLETHYNVRDPNVILTTAHKSKGREWDTVVLADDFPSVFDNKGKFVGLEDQERNLVYVAVTRAKKNLYFNDTVAEMLEVTQTTLSPQAHHIAKLLELKLNSDVFGEHCFTDVDDDYTGLQFRVKGIAHVDKYNIHKLPAFIDNNIGNHALDAVLRGIDELDMLEPFERGEMSHEEAYDLGLIDEQGYYMYSGDLYDQDSIGGMIYNHLMYMPTLSKPKKKKR